MSAVVTEALKTTPSSETLTGILKNTGDPIPLEPLALESSSSVGAAVTAEVADILQDGHASGSELQGHFPGSRGGSLSDTREPNAEELGANLRTLLSSSLTAGSRRSYQRARIIFSNFIANFTVLMILLYRYLLHASPYSSLISHFVNWLFQRLLHIFRPFPTYKLRGFHDPTKSFLIHKLLTALSRRQPVDIRLPVTRPVLHELVRALSFTNSSAFQRSLFSALFLVAFYGLFRIGELTAKSNRFASSVVQFGNLTFLSRNGRTHVAKITISEYKYNTSRRPFDILIAREVSLPFAPFYILRIAGILSSPPFLSC